jgi:ParB-like nuclease domain
MRIEIEYRAVDDLIPYIRNSRTHNEEQIAQIAGSIAAFGFVNPIIIGGDDVVIAGHGRLLAARKLQLEEVPCISLEHLSEAERRALVIADNRIAENAGWDEQMLKAELAALREDAFDMDLLGFAEAELGELLDALDAETSMSFDEQGNEVTTPSEQPKPSLGTLSDRFGVPPFSVLSARGGWWQDRKRIWIALGIRSELGRGAAPGGSPAPLDRGYNGSAAPGGSPMPATNYSNSKARGDGRGRPM